MGSSFDILIVGGGVAGLATAWWLGQLSSDSGRSATLGLLERDEQLATRSSALNAAILRTLDSSARVTEVLERSARFLRTPPEGFCEHPLVEPCGLILTADEGPAATEMAHWIEHCDPSIQVRELSREDVVRRAPRYHFAGQKAWLFPRQGRLDVAHLCESFAKGARAMGVQIMTGGAGHVDRLLLKENRVSGVIRADGSILRSRTVVLASGGWAGALGQAAGSRVALTPMRRHLLVTEEDPRIDASWPVVWRHGHAFYCRPESGGMLISACDDSVVFDPDQLERDPVVLESIACKTAANLPDMADAGAAHWWCGMRTMTRDGEFLIQFDPDVPGLFWVAGLGGHGMSASAEVGRLAAEQLLQAALPADRSSLPASI